ncbi:MAG: murein peptide amidase, partial [Solirubrobacteraceae bacterium]|nr:murein peptide amidase [Solirubrobacteraceae bacterium]
MVTLGRSRRGRPVTAVELGAAGARRRVLVVGVIHGDEPAGASIVRRLARGPAVADTDLWLIDDLNPDGVAAATRQNAAGVDLNRNFPFHWQPIGRRGDTPGRARCRSRRPASPTRSSCACGRRS